MLKINAKTGQATALTPGTVTVNCSWKDTSGNIYSSAARVSVPIAGFEVNEIDYSPYVGMKLSEVDPKSIASIKSVWAYGGNKITTNTDRYMTIELKTCWGSLETFENTTVRYNNNYEYVYTLRPNVSDGYFFAVSAEVDDDETRYYVDKSTLKCNGLDNGKIMSAQDYGASIEWNTPYTLHITNHSQKTYEAWYESGMYITLFHQPAIENPDAVYLDELNITVTEPAVGDNRYEGTNYNKMNEYLVLNVSGKLGEQINDYYTYSHVSKLDTKAIL